MEPEAAKRDRAANHQPRSAKYGERWLAPHSAYGVIDVCAPFASRSIAKLEHHPALSLNGQAYAALAGDTVLCFIMSIREKIVNLGQPSRDEHDEILRTPRACRKPPKFCSRGRSGRVTSVLESSHNESTFSSLVSSCDPLHNEMSEGLMCDADPATNSSHDKTPASGESENLVAQCLCIYM
jgi:hypothetical protein